MERWSADSIITLYMNELLHFISKYKIVFANKTYDHKRGIRNFAREVKTNKKMKLFPSCTKLSTCYLYRHQH